MRPADWHANDEVLVFNYQRQGACIFAFVHVFVCPVYLKPCRIIDYGCGKNPFNVRVMGLILLFPGNLGLTYPKLNPIHFGFLLHLMTITKTTTRILVKFCI